MKNSPLRRGKPLRRGSKPLARRSPVKAVNKARQAKRRAEYAGYLKSPQWKALRAEAMERAGNRCEHRDDMAVNSVFGTVPSLFSLRIRCRETDRLQVHHTRYPRVLGTESIDTLQVLCARHHDLAESQKFWKAPAPREGGR